MCNRIRPETHHPIETVPIKPNGWAYKVFGKTSDDRLVTPFDRYGKWFYEHDDKDRVEWNNKYVYDGALCGFALFNSKEAAKVAAESLTNRRRSWNFNPSAMTFVVRRVRYYGALICRSEPSNEFWEKLGPVFIIANAFKPIMRKGEYL